MAITFDDLRRAGIGTNGMNPNVIQVADMSIRGLPQNAPMPQQMPQQAPQPMPQQQPRRGLLGGLFGPEGRDARARLAIGLEGLTMNPNQGLIGQLQSGIEERKVEAERNRTLEYLSKLNTPAAQQALEYAQATGDVAGALKMALTPADPMAQINLQKAQLELEQLQNPQAEFRRATTEEAAAYGAAAGQFGPDGRFYAVDVPQNMTIETDSEGNFRLVQGQGAASTKPFTEGQSKDVVFATRARGALGVLEPVAENLTNYGMRVAELDPTGLVRGKVQSPEFQVAKNAGDEFLQAILRKDTGAAITPGEQTLYGGVYLPQPGDGPEVLAAKKDARIRAVSAIEAGMSPAQMLAQEKGLAGSPDAAVGDVVQPNGTAGTTSNRLKYDSMGNLIK
jgi:hypothetical protein